MGYTRHYMTVEPDSHYWSDLEMLVRTLEFDIKWHDSNTERDDISDYPIIDTYIPVTKEYLLIGLRNTLKNGYDLEFNIKNVQEVPPPYYFSSIKEILNYLEINWNIEDFIYLFNCTIKNGYDLKHKNKMKMEKNEIYNRIDTELKYQDLRWMPLRAENGTPDESKPPAEWINYMEYHIGQAKNGVYMLDDKEALGQIRKVVALGVRALMIHGCPERVIAPELLKLLDNDGTLLNVPVGSTLKVDKGGSLKVGKPSCGCDDCGCEK